MVVFDKNHVVQANPVIDASSGKNMPIFRAISFRVWSFACQGVGSERFNHAGKHSCFGGDTAQPLHDVQHKTLGGQDGGYMPADAESKFSMPDFFSVLLKGSKNQAFVIEMKTCSAIAIPHIQPWSFTISLAVPHWSLWMVERVV
jgi:hypothetical protein